MGRSTLELDEAQFRRVACRFPLDVFEYWEQKAAQARQISGGYVTISQVIIEQTRQLMPKVQAQNHKKGRPPKPR